MRRQLFTGLFLLLAGVALADPGIKLQWTAPGDDGAIGTAAQYDARYATSRPDTSNAAAMASWWAAARQISGFPRPLLAGTAQSDTVFQAGGFAADSTYYFAMRTADEKPNWSLISNVAAVMPLDTIPPARVTTLRIVP